MYDYFQFTNQFRHVHTCMTHVPRVSGAEPSDVRLWISDFGNLWLQILCNSVPSAASSLFSLFCPYMAYIPSHALAALRDYRYKGVDKCVAPVTHSRHNV